MWQTMWQTMRQTSEREAGKFDCARFTFGRKTMGIHSRPACPAPAAKRQNAAEVL